MTYILTALAWFCYFILAGFGMMLGMMLAESLVEKKRKGEPILGFNGFLRGMSKKPAKAS
jgi:cytochrome bd-type quinol oxidase subunit 2